MTLSPKESLSKALLPVVKEQRDFFVRETGVRIRIETDREKKEREDLIRKQFKLVQKIVLRRAEIIRRIAESIRKKIDQEEISPEELKKIAEVEYKKIFDNIFKEGIFHEDMANSLDLFTKKNISPHTLSLSYSFQKIIHEIAREITDFAKEKKLDIRIIPDGSAVKGTLLVQKGKAIDFDFLVVLKDEEAKEKIGGILQDYLVKNWQSVTRITSKRIFDKGLIIQGKALKGRYENDESFYDTETFEKMKKQSFHSFLSNPCEFDFQIIFDPNGRLREDKILNQKTVLTLEKLRASEPDRHEQTIRIILFLKLWLQKNYAYLGSRSCFGGTALEALVLSNRGNLVTILKYLIENSFKEVKEAENGGSFLVDKSESNILVESSKLQENALTAVSIDPLIDCEKLNEENLFRKMNQVGFLLTVRAFFLLILETFKELKNDIDKNPESFAKKSQEIKKTTRRPLTIDVNPDAGKSAYIRRLDEEIKGTHSFLALINKILVQATRDQLEKEESKKRKVLQRAKKNAKDKMKQDLEKNKQQIKQKRSEFQHRTKKEAEA